jgi:hypothetical protein
MRLLWKMLRLVGVVLELQVAVGLLDGFLGRILRES